MFSTKEIKRLYHEEKWSINQVADFLGCSPGLVVGRLGNTIRSREEAGRIKQFILVSNLFLGSSRINRAAIAAPSLYGRTV